MRENEEQTYTCSECGAVVDEESIHTFDERVYATSVWSG